VYPHRHQHQLPSLRQQTAFPEGTIAVYHTFSENASFFRNFFKKVSKTGRETKPDRFQTHLHQIIVLDM